ncbi:MAG TPA: FIST N-terminal domain-containing protein, partial [Candidatus Acidoferrum sp.]|nr:FIST N-terminal domain-containing protein [Candidatus Acidoferrum sp.]
EQPGMQVVLFFCSPSYDLARLGAAIRGAFPCPVIGCTSAGQLGPGGYQRGGIVAASLASSELAVRPHLIAPLSECRERAAALAMQVNADLKQMPAGRSAFGFMLVDGLARAEEALAATLYQGLGDVPIVGGSAGDDLRFERTSVYWDGEFLTGAAVVAIFETSLRFAALKLQHFRPTDKRLVITAADASTRLVREINGRPAADAYAELLGMRTADLDSSVFSANPVMLRIGAEYYVRSIQRVNPDHSLSFYCAIDEGLVLVIGRALDPLATLERGLSDVARDIGTPSLIIGCDCILRRLEIEQLDLVEPVGRLLAAHRVIGFNTYGEQFNGIHVNQTFTGIALGG